MLGTLFYRDKIRRVTVSGRSVRAGTVIVNSDAHPLAFEQAVFPWEQQPAPSRWIIQGAFPIASRNAV